MTLVSPAVVVLAAGAGRRFGASRPKLAQSLDGRSVLAHTLRHAVASGLPVVVVTIAALQAHAQRVVAARDVIVLPDGLARDEGIGTSIAAGVAACPDASGWVVLPGDMPLVQPHTLGEVARALAEYPVAYAQHAGRRGHPVGFSAELYSELIALRGDEGVRRLVARFPAQAVDVDDPGVLLDIDTAADLAALRLASGAGQGMGAASR